MALNKYATIRYRVIDRCIRSRSHPYPSKESLRQACEEELYGSTTGEHISISTIEKDLSALKNESTFGYAPIAYNKAENGYYYTDSTYSLDLPLSETDIELIRLATNTLVQFKDSQIFSALEQAVDKIQGRLNVIGHMHSQDTQSMIRFEESAPSTGNEHLAILLDCIENRSIITLSYTPFVDDQKRDFIVHPYLLQEHKNRWYLICFDTGDKKFRTLGLDRIHDIVTNNKCYLPDSSFNPEDYYKYAFGIGIYSGEPCEIIFWVDNVQGKYLLAKPLHKTQKLLERTADGFKLQIQVIPSPELTMHLMSYGNRLRVYAPASIREEIKKGHQLAFQQYS